MLPGWGISPRKRPITCATAEERRAAVESGGRHPLLGEMGLQVYAWDQIGVLLTTEPFETNNTAALSDALWKAYITGYHPAAHGHGWEIKE